MARTACYKIDLLDENVDSFIKTHVLIYHLYKISL